MKYCLITLLLALSMLGCANKEHADLFDYSKPVDLLYILQAYEWQKDYEEDDKDSILTEKIAPGLPEDDIYLFEDTSFVLRVPEYAASKQPFLANAEDFYNSCCLSWNIYSNYEVWYRGHTSDLLRDDNDVIQSIKNMSIDIIHNKDVRNAARLFKDSLLFLMEKTPDQWKENVDAMNYVVSFGDVVEHNAYKFYDDEEAFVNSLDSVVDIAEGMAMDRFQHYLDASEEVQLKVILGELAACQNFDEQCSLWRNWANCNKSDIEDEWLVSVGIALMKSGKYSPILHRIWITWRSICQCIYYGASRDSAIPNQYYNEFRKMCYLSCLKRIAAHPSDRYAMNCAAAIGGRTNMNRFGMNCFGNECMIEGVMMMPKRYGLGENSK